MPLHIHMTIALERDTLGLKERPLATPAGCRAALLVHHTMAGQLLRPWRITQRPAYHPRMAWPTRPSRDMTISGHPSARNLADDMEHGIAKRPCLLWRHLIGIVLHPPLLDQLDNLLLGGFGQQLAQVRKHPLERLLRRPLTLAHFTP